MPEIKNTFLKSKMNKDLDSRIIPNGEYRDAENVSVSTSEGADVGALENILGNIEIADFGLTDLNLEVIGHCTDVSNNRIFFFITNYTDASVGVNSNLSVPDASFSDPTGVGNWTRTGSANYICYAQISGDAIDVNVTNVSSSVLVSGTFLNFSTTNPILGVNVLEDLLFWTDDRNQPRKINIKRAISSPYVSALNPGYYTHEDHISVAKYAPYTSINFLKEVNVGSEKETTLINEVDEWLPPIVIAPGEIVKDSRDSIKLKDDFDIQKYIGDATSIPIKVTLTGESGEAYIDFFDNSNDHIFDLKDKNGSPIDDISGVYGISYGTETSIFKIIEFSIKNPNYNEEFEGDVDLLKEKFVRFSYRFKYDDGEYSLTAPFSQHAFTPEQFGYFIGDDDKRTAESSIVDFMKNQVTTAGLMIDLPCPPNELANTLHVEELQILYKASDEQSLKVVADVDSDGLKQGLASTLDVNNGGTGFSTTTYINTQGGSGTGLRVNIESVNAPLDSILSVKVITHGAGYKINDVITIPSPTSGGASAELTIVSLESKYLYNYKSQKPIKVLPEKEIVRVSDIVPLKAKTQEIVGNRIIYGNFLQNNETPNSLRYSVSKNEKGFNVDQKINEELLNHTLKQNRTYQVGIVLQDRYGRSSNVIINNDNTGLTKFSSTFFSPYSNGGVDPLSWPGNSLVVDFDEKISETKTPTYNGIWVDKENPTGWYTYKIVVKQQEQDYYNIYVPGSVTGNINYDPTFAFGTTKIPVINYNDENSVNHIALFNDNINKIPRNLSEVGPSDKIYSSDTVLYNRVNNKNVQVELGLPDISEQTLIVNSNEVTSIKPFSEMGDWVVLKGIDLHFLHMDPNAVTPEPKSQYNNKDTFAYPGEFGNIDPFFLDNNKNPLIATIKTKRRIGATVAQQSNRDSPEFSKTLTIFETKPVKSEIDIYYETSSSGTVEEFNNGVENSSGELVITSTTAIQSIYPEGVDVSGSDYISNNFQIVDQNGNIISDSSIEVSVGSVQDANGSPVTTIPFKVVESVPSSGLSNQAQFVFARTQRQAFLENSTTANSYTITLNVTNNSGVNISIPNVSLNLSNNKPVIELMHPTNVALTNLYQSDSISGNALFNFDNNYSNNLPPAFPLNQDIILSGLQNQNRTIQAISKSSLAQAAILDGYIPVALFSYTSNGSVKDFIGDDQYSDTFLRLGGLNAGTIRLEDLARNVQSVCIHPCDYLRTNSQLIKIYGSPEGETILHTNFDIKLIGDSIYVTMEVNSSFISFYRSLTFVVTDAIVTLKVNLRDANINGAQAETSDDFILRFVLLK